MAAVVLLPNMNIKSRKVELNYLLSKLMGVSLAVY